MPDIRKNCRSQNISDNVLWSCYIWFYYGSYSASGHSVRNLSESGASESHILHLVFLDQVLPHLVLLHLVLLNLLVLHLVLLHLVLRNLVLFHLDFLNLVLIYNIRYRRGTE